MYYNLSWVFDWVVDIVGKDPASEFCLYYAYNSIKWKITGLPTKY